jgi:hypothetical protein
MAARRGCLEEVPQHVVVDRESVRVGTAVACSQPLSEKCGSRPEVEQPPSAAGFLDEALVTVAATPRPEALVEHHGRAVPRIRRSSASSSCRAASANAAYSVCG